MGAAGTSNGVNNEHGTLNGGAKGLLMHTLAPQFEVPCVTLNDNAHHYTTDVDFRPL